MVQPLSEVQVDPEAQAAADAIAIHRAVVSSQITAVVTQVPVDVGQVVAAGEVLVTLESIDYELALADARAAVEAADARETLARQRLDDALALSGRQFVSAEDLAIRRSELDVQRSTAQRARIAVEQAETRLARTRITAPFDGVVASRSAQLGALLVPGSAVAELVGRQPVEIEAQVPVAMLSGLRQVARAAFLASSGRHPVVFERATDVVAGASDTVAVRLRPIDTLPLPGESGTLAWRPARGLIPPDLVVQRDGRLGVFVVASGCADFVALPQAQAGRPAPHELAPGTRLVTRGQHLLLSGECQAITE